MRSSYVFWALAAGVAFGSIAIFIPDAVGALVIIVVLSLALLGLLRPNTNDPIFVTKIFFASLGLRLFFGGLVYVFDAMQYFGGDALTYDYKGSLIVDYWHGLVPANTPELARAMTTNGPGWGMNYLVAGVYYFFGKNFLAAQTFAAVVGAAVAPLVYVCTLNIYKNQRASRLAAIGVAVFPAFIIWSGQLLKDGLIVFLLVLTMTAVLKLQEKFSYGAVLIIVLSLFGIVSLRFYIFYVVIVAVAGSFILGVSNTIASVVRRAIVLVILGVGLTYLGVVQTATVDIETFGDLERLQMSRLDQATNADSGYADDIDVSTTRGAITAIPIGFVYLMLAPFPWEVRNLRQAITLPEVLAWWAMMPLLFWGLWYTVKHRLRPAFSILLFSAMLTLAYSIFQANVGTAYRQRTQIQVFLFMFIAVGWVLWKERREDRKVVRGPR